MSPYAVVLTPAAERDLAKLDRSARQAAAAALSALALNPRPPGCVKLAGAPDLWRIRFGRYRVVYRIEDARLLVIVVKIADRKDVYR